MMLAERSLGRLAIQVPVISFGTAALVNLYQPVPEAEAIAAVHTAIADGIRMFDSSPFYSSTHSERRLGEALRPGEYQSFMDSTRILSAYSKLPYIAEFGAGIWHDWLAEVGILTPKHYRLVGLSALLSGIVGWNWYMLVNRDNWAMAPINEQGRTHPDLFAVFQQMTALFNMIDPPTLTRQVTSALTNNGEEAKAVELHLRGSSRYQASDLLRGGTFAIDTDSPIYLPLPRKDGTVLRLIPQP